MQAFDVVKKQLLGRLHDIARAQIFPPGMVAPSPTLPQLPSPRDSNGSGRAMLPQPGQTSHSNGIVEAVLPPASTRGQK